jgi:hypothetical protein
MVPARVTLFGDATHDVEKINKAKSSDNVDRAIKFFIIITYLLTRELSKEKMAHEAA